MMVTLNGNKFLFNKDIEMSFGFYFCVMDVCNFNFLFKCRPHLSVKHISISFHMALVFSKETIMKLRVK